MISKGFNFPKLNCMVVLDADFSGRGYDLRATEKYTIIPSIKWESRTFQR